VAAIAAGEKISSGDKEVGEITSVAVLRGASTERTVALGYIRREVGVPGREVMIGEAKATVAQLPLESFALEKAQDAVLHKV
jgi:glycine cleavage system aminomethyltransferase T